MEELIDGFNKVHNSKYTYGEFVYKNTKKRRIYLFAVIIKINRVMSMVHMVY